MAEIKGIGIPSPIKGECPKCGEERALIPSMISISEDGTNILVQYVCSYCGESVG